MNLRFAFLVLMCALATGLMASFVACGGDDDDDADTTPSVTLQECVDAFSRLYGPEGCQVAMYDEATIEELCSARQGQADANDCVMALYADNIDCINAVECGAETADADYAACEETFQTAAGSC